jgi:hypothetical protein
LSRVGPLDEADRTAMLRPIPGAEAREPAFEVSQDLLDDRGLITDVTFRATSPSSPPTLEAIPV